jgi:hypothetical protein
MVRIALVAMDLHLQQVAEYEIDLKGASNLSRFVGSQQSIRPHEMCDGYHFNIQCRD